MRLRSICAAVLGTMMLADSALALSCMRPELVKTLEDAKASDKLYYILVGKFVSLTPRPKGKPHGGHLSPEDQFKSKPSMITRAYFEGYSLAKHPRQDAYLSRFPVDIETSCTGPWCSDVPSGNSEMIAFVEARQGQAPLLKISPCPYWTFDAAPQKVKKLRNCLDKTCEVEAPNW